MCKVTYKCKELLIVTRSYQNDSSGPQTLHIHRCYFLFFLALDEGDIALLKTYVSTRLQMDVQL